MRTRILLFAGVIMVFMVTLLAVLTVILGKRGNFTVLFHIMCVQCRRKESDYTGPMSCTGSCLRFRFDISGRFYKYRCR